MNNPLISVIMSVRNSVSTIESSVNCILNQSYGNFEFIIIDDSSEDKTYEILKKYSLKDDRIKLIRNKYQIGLTKSLNIAAKISKGEFIARQDGDDFSFNNRFQKQIEFFKKNKNHVMTGTWFNICIGNLKIEKKFKNDHNYLSKKVYASS